MRFKMSRIGGLLGRARRRHSGELVIEGGNSGYPAYVSSAGERLRWDLSMKIARELERRETGGGATMVWYSTRSIYRSDLTTDEIASHRYVQG